MGFYTEREYGGLIFIYKNGVLVDIAQSINFTNGTLTTDGDGNVTYTAPAGGGGGGYTVETPTGSGKNFTVTATPVYLVVDNVTLFEGFGYSIVGLNITLEVPMVNFIRSFYT